MKTKVMALHCHPDDIEFMMSGTLFLLKDAGCEIHYMNIANGCCGSSVYSREEIIEVRRAEAVKAASCLGAHWYESLTDDLDVFYEPGIISRTAAVIREVAPDILLLPSPEDYMEDHMNTCRIGVTAAFCRSIPNYVTTPERPVTEQNTALYHCMPHGLTDGFRRAIHPDFFINIDSVIQKKTEMLSCHKSQKEWLDTSQGMDSYLHTMQEMCAALGRESGGAEYAEGWRRHSHYGFTSEEADPLSDILQKYRITKL